MNVERRTVVVGQVEQVEKIGVGSKVGDAVADCLGVCAGESDILRRVSGDAHAGTLDSGRDGVESSANVRPVGQLLQGQVDVRMVDDRSER